MDRPEKPAPAPVCAESPVMVAVLPSFLAARLQRTFGSSSTQVRAKPVARDRGLEPRPRRFARLWAGSQGV